MARPKCISPWDAENSKRAKWRVLNTALGGSCNYHSNRSAHSRSRYNVKVYQRSMCLRYGAAQPLQSNLFRSFPASRYRTVAERVMDVGASLLRGTYETRGAPLRSSASDVGHFIHCCFAPLPFPPPRCLSFTPSTSFGSRFSITGTNLPLTVSVWISYVREG